MNYPYPPYWNSLVGHNLIIGETIVSDLRHEMLKRITERWQQGEPLESIIQSLREIESEFLDIWAEHYLGSDMSAWLSSYDWQVQDLPDWLKNQLAKDNARNRGRPPLPPGALLTGFGSGPFEIRFTLIEEAARSLFQKNILTREEFDAATREAKKRAFTITGDLTQSAIADVRDELANLIKEGPTLKEFRERIENKIGGGRAPLSPSRIETVYRTNLHRSYRQGREQLLANPLVGQHFPFQMYVHISDGRTRKNHRALGKLGLKDINGNPTGIYWRSDPMWIHFTPPWEFNCRCGAIAMTLEQAAAENIAVAAEWLRSGQPPAKETIEYATLPFEPSLSFAA